MSDYDGMDYEELLDECEWMSSFLSMMAERITEDPDVHNLVDYVRKIEGENAKLRRLVCKFYHCQKHRECVDCPYVDDTSCFLEDEFRELGIEVNK